MSRLEFHFTNHGCPNPNCPMHYKRDHQNAWDWYTTNDQSEGVSPFHRQQSISRRRKKANYNTYKKTQSNTETSLSRFLIDALARSSISGVNNIASSASAWIKLRWIFVLIACLCGFCYQAFRFVTLYSNRPSSVQIDIESDGDAEFPAVTICNLNRMRKSEYCSHYPVKCPNGTVQQKVTDAVIKEVMGDLLRKNESDIRKKLGHSESMIPSCIFNGRPVLLEEECRQNLIYFYDPDFGNCYTLPSKDKLGRTLQANEADFWQEANDLSILINIEADEFIEGKRDPGVILTVHSGSSFPDVHTDGIVLVSGYSYKVAVQKKTMKFLPLPYKTNCTNFLSLPWAKGSKQLTARMCTVGCSQHHQLKKCGYVTESLSLFYDSIPWNIKTVTEEKVNCAKIEEEASKSHCRAICGVPCRDTVFELSLGSSSLTASELRDHHFPDSENWMWDIKRRNLAYVKIYYKTLEHTTFQHVPKYDTLAFFSYLGGYSGVWLGFSLLTVYEFLEILFSTLKFGVSKYNRISNHRKVAREFINVKKYPKTSVKHQRKRSHYR